MSKMLKKITSLLLVLILVLSMPLAAIADEENGNKENDPQNNSRVIDDPSLELNPVVGGGTLLFSMTAGKVYDMVRSNNSDDSKKFKVSDLPTSAVYMRFFGILTHSYGDKLVSKSTRGGICYYNASVGMYAYACKEDEFSGGTIDTTFTISEKLVSGVTYYGYIKNIYYVDEELQGYVSGTLYFYTYSG